MRRIVFVTAATIALTTLALVAGWRSWTGILGGALVITTQKVCQVTGDWDREWSQSTRTLSFGATGTDLGNPVLFNNKLYFLFGDTRDTPPDQVVQSPNGFDSMAVGPVNADIKRNGCIELAFEAEEAPGGPHFRPIQVQELDVHDGKLRTLGPFETPVTGFANGKDFYAFFTLRDHSPGCRIKMPDGCALGDEGFDTLEGLGGRAILALSNDGGVTFSKVSDISKLKFQWPVAVVRDARSIPRLPEWIDDVHFDGPVVLIWGSGREGYYFRRGYPFFAVAPLQTVKNMSTWRYLTGLGCRFYFFCETPLFTTTEADATPLPPFGHERSASVDQPPYHSCVGEFSVGFIEPWHKWAMLYACSDRRNDGYNKDNVRGIYLRTADVPWGPWSGPKLIFQPKDGYCHFMHDQRPCPAGAPNASDAGQLDSRGEQAFGGSTHPLSCRPTPRHRTMSRRFTS